MYFVSSPTCVDKHKVICILCSLTWEFKPRWDTFCVIAGKGGLFCQHMLRWTFCPCWHGGVGWSFVEIHFVLSLPYEGFAILRCIVSSLACHGISHHVIRCTMCICWHRKCLVNISCGTFCGHAIIGWLWSRHVEMHLVTFLGWDMHFMISLAWWSTHFKIHFVFSLALVGFSEHMLR